MHSRPRLILVALAALAALAIACGGDDGDPVARPTRPPSGAPGSSPSPATSAPSGTPAPFVYIVKDGDTLAGIATLFGVDVETLMKANGVTDPTSLQVGQQIVIPGISSPPPTAAPTPVPTDDPPDPTSPPGNGGEVSLTQLVDKQHALPDGYAPPDLIQVTGGYIAPGYSAQLRQEALAAAVRMMDAAYAAGYDIRVVSGYRSYDTQVATFNYWVQQLGEEQARRVSAEPGHSEHQLGTTADFGSPTVSWALTEGFGATPEGQWLAEHSAEYGFALSYPQGAEATTGYAYEPWHYRYIGLEAAQQWKVSGLPLNQFLGA